MRLLQGEPGIAILESESRIDTFYPRIREELNGEDLIVDMSGSSEISATGLADLVILSKEMERRGRHVVLSGVPPKIEGTIRTMTQTRFKTYQTLREATEELQGSYKEENRYQEI